MSKLKKIKNRMIENGETTSDWNEVVETINEAKGIGKLDELEFELMLETGSSYPDFNCLCCPPRTGRARELELAIVQEKKRLDELLNA